MKLIKFDKHELPNSVKDALIHYGDSNEFTLPKVEIDNAWIKFSNTLDFIEKESIRDARVAKNQRFRFKSLLPTFSGLSTAAVLIYFVVQSSNQKIENEMASQSNFNKIAIANSSKEYELPKPEKFSELVSFVKEEKSKENHESILVRNSLKEVENNSYNRRLSAELEQSLRDSFNNGSGQLAEIDSVDTTLSSNLMRADGADSANIVYVSR